MVGSERLYRAELRGATGLAEVMLTIKEDGSGATVPQAPDNSCCEAQGSARTAVRCRRGSRPCCSAWVPEAVLGWKKVTEVAV